MNLETLPESSEIWKQTVPQNKRILGLFYWFTLEKKLTQKEAVKQAWRLGIRIPEKS